jgi:hypothetical protein
MKQIFIPDPPQPCLVGPSGTLAVLDNDDITRKFCMLYEGQCLGLGATQAAQKYGLSRPRYYQLLALFEQAGAPALQNHKRGPKTPSRRTPEVTRQVIRHRFLDAQASPAVIAQKLEQTDHSISIRSVERIIEDFGLQKKTLRRPPQ